MSRVLAAYTDSHPIRLDIFESVLADDEIDVLEVSDEADDTEAEAALIDRLDDHDALFTRSVAVTERVLDAAPSLRTVVTHSSGYDHLDVEAATERGIVVVHNPDGVAPGVVEHTFAMAFTLLRDLPRRYEQTAAGEWYEAREILPELGTRTMGVVGLGTIGFRVASIAASGFGADVVGYDPYVAGERESPIFPRVDRATVEASGIEVVDKDDLFERADVVSVHVPLTPETRGFIGERDFDRLDGGIFINVARGPVVDEAALLAALEDGRVGKAGLDVFEVEPTGNEALRSHPNVQATPHVAGVTDGYLERTARLGAEKIRTVLEGGVPETVLNPGVIEERSREELRE